MTQQTAIQLIEKGVKHPSGTWADIGAGTGTFTLALREIMSSGKIYAVDKSPHALWRLPLKGAIPIEVTEGDFNRPFDMPELDGIVLANTLHYAADPVAALKNMVQHLKADGSFILVEYETSTPLPPWIPFPIPFEKFKDIAKAAGLTEPIKIGKAPSNYGHDHMYAVYCEKDKKPNPSDL